ncbi:claudin-24-like [Lampetra fluviatilis]
MARVCDLQLVGLAVSVCGWLLACVTTVLPHWQSLNSDIAPLAENFLIGLWGSCVDQGDNIQCRDYESLMDLIPTLQMARILMCAADVLGLVGTLLTALGMRCTTFLGGGGNTTHKRAASLAGALAFLVASAAVMAPVCTVAVDTVALFFDENIPDYVPRWEFGEALFAGWMASFLLFAGGLALAVAACLAKRPGRGPPARSVRRIARPLPPAESPGAGDLFKQQQQLQQLRRVEMSEFQTVPQRDLVSPETSFSSSSSSTRKAKVNFLDANAPNGRAVSVYV